MKKLITLFIIVFVFTQCSKEPFGVVEPHEEYLFSQHGFFIVNEGNFNFGNGSLSFYSFDSTKLYDAVFNGTNGRVLGDVPQYMTSIDTIGMVTVNNSNKIEFFSTNTLKSIGTIHGLTSPREIAVVNTEKAYVSDLYNDSLSVINPQTQELIKKIPLGRTSESLVIHNQKLFAANWSKYATPEIMNNKIMVVDISQDKVVDSIQVTIEPNSMVLDSKGFLWVLCSGGYNHEEHPALFKINTHTHEIEKRLEFPNINASPSNLVIDSEDNLYFINQDIYKMSTLDSAIPQTAFIPSNQTYYELEVIDDKIVIADALDYQQKGMIFIYNKTGELQTSFRAGIIPGYFYTLP